MSEKKPTPKEDEWVERYIDFWVGVTVRALALYDNDEAQRAGPFTIGQATRKAPEKVEKVLRRMYAEAQPKAKDANPS